MLTTSRRKHLEDISHAHVVSSMYKLTTSAAQTILMICLFDLIVIVLGGHES